MSELPSNIIRFPTELRREPAETEIEGNQLGSYARIFSERIRGRLDSHLVGHEETRSGHAYFFDLRDSGTELAVFDVDRADELILFGVQDNRLYGTVAAKPGLASVETVEIDDEWLLKVLQGIDEESWQPLDAADCFEAVQVLDFELAER